MLLSVYTLLNTTLQHAKPLYCYLGKCKGIRYQVASIRYQVGIRLPAHPGYQHTQGGGGRGEGCVPVT